MAGVTFTVNVAGNASSFFNELGRSLGTTSAAIKQLSIESIADGISKLKAGFNSVTAPSLALNDSMTELKAITGVGADSLKLIEKNARSLGLQFGTDTAGNVESFKTILSKLSPDIAQNSEALKLMGANVNVMSKGLKGDTVAATKLLTTSMNQFGVSVKDPIAGAHKMTEMMNVMAAAAKVGSAELPQIEQALEQVGGVAKTVGVSFEETNAAIQVLDKAGKKGAEGGVALRNIMAKLSEGEWLPKEVLETLKGAGVNVKALGDKSKPLADRLEALKPVMKDTAFVTAMFGTENMLAAQAIFDNREVLRDYTTQVTGTNAAQEYADIVMSSWSEKIKRNTAFIDDLKISFGNAMGSMIPFVETAMAGVVGLGDMAHATSSISTLLKSDFISSVMDSIKAINIQSAVSKIAAISSLGLSGALRAIGFAIASIPVIGWIAIGITAAAIAIKYAWDNSKHFRASLYGIWEAAKAVFHNISVVVVKVWNGIIKPIIIAHLKLYKLIFGGIYMLVKSVINSIATLFKSVYEVVSSVVMGIYGVVSWVFNGIWSAITYVGGLIASFFQNLWNWFATLFPGFASAINDWVIQPIKNAFSGLWDFLSSIFNWIMDGLKRMIQPVIDIYNAIFGKDSGMISVSASYDIGYKKGENAYDAGKNKPNEAPQATDMTAIANNAALKTGLTQPSNDTVTKAGGKKDNSGGGAGGNSNRNISIAKFIETLVINVAGTDDKKIGLKVKEAVMDALVTGLSDANSIVE